MFIYHLCYESSPHNVFSNLDYDSLWYTDILTIYVTKAFKIFCKLRKTFSIPELHMCVSVFICTFNSWIKLYSCWLIGSRHLIIFL